MYVNQAVLSTNQKSLFYFDADENKIVKYNCVLKRDVDRSDIGYLCSFLYGMKLSSNSVNGGTLREGKTTCDVIHEIENIISSTTISFRALLSLFNIENTPQQVLEAPIRGILDLFDIENKQEYSGNLENLSTSEFDMNRDCTKDLLVANTLALKDISIDTFMKKDQLHSGKEFVKAS